MGVKNFCSCLIQLVQFARSLKKPRPSDAKSWSRRTEWDMVKANLTFKTVFQMTQKPMPIAGQAIIAGQTRVGCWFRVFLSLYTSHHETSYAFKPVKGFVSGFKENRDGKGTQREELNNMNPSKSSHTVSQLCGGHSNWCDEICPFWPLLHGPPEYSAVFARNYFQMAKFYAVDHACLTPLGMWSDSCEDLRETETVKLLRKKSLTIWPQARALRVSESREVGTQTPLMQYVHFGQVCVDPLIFQQSLRGPTFKWPSSTLPSIARLRLLGLWTDLCEDLEKTKTVEALSRKSLTMWLQARALTES